MSGIYEFKKASPKYDKFLNADATSLRDEIALTRVMIESMVDECEDALEFVSKSPQLLSVLETLRNLMVAGSKLDEASGKMLHIAEVQVIIEQILKILAKHVSKEVLGVVKEELVCLLQNR